MSASTNSPATSELRYGVEVQHDVRIPTQQPDVTLSADLYLPVGATRVPVLLMVMPYRKDIGFMVSTRMRWFAKHGYAGLIVDLRGTGSSDGDRRPEFHPGEADDAVAAIDWATSQSWCDGSVGMWGASYMGTLTLRTASRRPPALKAIIVTQCPLDPERDVIHPQGERGDLHALAHRGSMMLARQLLPSLLNYTSAAEQRRWQYRLHHTEPAFVNFAQHAPGAPLWRDWVIDAESITTPALCFGGWRDKNADAIPRAYERMQGPKKLVMGPWMHTPLEEAPVEPVDFPAMALRWWDYWLRGLENGVMDEAAVSLYVQGRDSGWRSYDSWPPAKTELVLRTGDDTTLKAIAASSTCARTIAEYQPDPTTGALSGLWGLATPGFGLPVDQHDDDMRAVSATSEPLPEDLILSGRPEVTVHLTATDPVEATVARRLVVRLTDVDPQGRSLFIVAGVARSDTTGSTHRITLWPTTYRLPAGHRLRVVLSDSDFPRLTPLVSPNPIQVSAIELHAPTVPLETEAIPTLPPTKTSDPVQNLGHWTITRDLINHGIEVNIGTGSPPAYIRCSQGHLLHEQGEERATVRRDAPDAAVITRTHRIHASMNTGENIVVTATIRCTQTALWARGEVTIDETPVFCRSWNIPLQETV